MFKSDLQIFIIDDNRKIGQIICDCLIENGYIHIEYFSNPIYTYSKICNKNINFKYAVVLVDQNIPKIKGEDLLYHFQSVIPINCAIITSEKNSVSSNKYSIFEKGTSEFFFEMFDYLEELIQKY